MTARHNAHRILFVISSIVFLLSASALQAGQISIDYSFAAPRIVQTKIAGESYHRIIMEDASNGGLIGHPSLPARGAQILLPPGEIVESIEVISGEPLSLGDSFLIEPVGQPIKLSAAPGSGVPVLADAVIYSSTQPYPAVKFNEIGTQGFRGYQILTVSLNPVQYVPLSGELSYFDQMTVVVNTIASNVPTPLFRGLEADEADVMSKVDNTETAVSYWTAARRSPSDYDLLIITQPSLVASFQPLKDYHDTTGILTEIHSTTDIGSTDPDVVRDYIRDRYLNDGISYVLIGGDDDLIPARDLFVISWEGSEAEIEYNMPADLYFGCLDGTYNYDGDNLWGEPTDGEGGGDVDLIAEVYVGRASVGDATEADRFVNKTIGYMTSIPISFDSVLMCGEYLGFGGVSDYAGNMMDEIVDSSSSGGYSTIGIPSDKYSIDRLYDRDWSANDWPVAELTSRINNGLHLINHLGHGNASSAMKMTSGTILSSLTNDEHFFLYSQACYSGQFDYSDCYAEYMTIKTDHGAFALVMNARYGWGTENTTDGPSQRYDREFWDAVFNPSESKPELGRAHHDSKEDNLHRINQSCMRWCYYETTLLGDPTVSIKGVNGLAFEYPDGIPEMTLPGEVTAFTVVVTGVGDGQAISGSGLLHYSINGGNWQSTDMTELFPGEYSAELPALDCGDQLEFYVSVEDVVLGTVYDPDPSFPHAVSPGTDQVAVFADDFETNKSWQVSDSQWARGIPSGGGGEYGGPDPTGGCDGPNVFGYNLAGDYDNNIPEYHLTSPAIDCSDLTNVHLTYMRWLGIEEPAYDHAYIRISADGINWTTIWSNSTEITDTSWIEVEHRIAEIADHQPTVYIRWTMGSTDSGWRFCGWNIDDVRISGYLCHDNLVIITDSLPTWTAGHEMNNPLQAAGGSGVYSWSDMNGDLIGSGLSLTANGILTGTALTPGTVSFTARVVDEAEGVDQRFYSFEVNPELSIMTTSLPDWTVDITYSSQLEADGGTPSLAWTDRDNSLDGTGLSLSATGLLSGAPEAAGTISFTAWVTDQVGALSEQLFSFEINLPVAIMTQTIPVCSTYYVYAVPLMAMGGTGELTWIDVGGNLPGTGFELTPAGVFAGMTNTPDTLTFTARVSDAVGSVDEVEYVVEIVRLFACGDANGDEAINLGDAVFLVNHVFKDGISPEPVVAGDANCDGAVNVGDAVYLINHVFKGGDPPCCP